MLLVPSTLCLCKGLEHPLLLQEWCEGSGGKEVSEGVGSFAFQSSKSDISQKILHSDSSQVCLVLISLCSWNKNFKDCPRLCGRCRVELRAQDPDLPHKPPAFLSCFGQDTALKTS